MKTRLNLKSVMKLVTATCQWTLLLALLLVSWTAGAQTTLALVLLTDTNGVRIIGELKKEDSNQLELIELKSARSLKFKIGEWNDFRRGITEREAVRATLI